MAISHTDLTASDLGCAARQIRDANQARLCLVIVLMMEGRSRIKEAEHPGMQRQPLRDWVHRYNADGVADLLKQPRSARPGLLSLDQSAVFDRSVEAGIDVALDGVVRKRQVDLKDVIARRFGVVMAERTLGDILHARGLSHMSARPRHARRDESVQEAFERASPSPSPA